MTRFNLCKIDLMDMKYLNKHLSLQMKGKYNEMQE